MIFINQNEIWLINLDPTIGADNIKIRTAIIVGIMTGGLLFKIIKIRIGMNLIQLWKYSRHFQLHLDEIQSLINK